MSTSPLTFTGVSTFSNDFQTILQRAVSIAQLPVKKLQNEQTDNLSKKQALIALDPAVASLGSAVAALGTLAANQGLAASSSDSSTVSVLNTGATSPVTYTISKIKTLATAASETSLLGYANSQSTPVSVAGQNKVDLVVGSTTYHLDLTGKNNLLGLRDAINNLGAGVSASILTTGNGNFLSIAASSLGATTLTLGDVQNPVSLISNTGTGTETSLVGYPDTGTTAVSTSGKVDLQVASGATIHLDITGNNNLAGLRDAINNAAAGVTASISNVAGSNYLTLTAAGGPTSINLSDIPASVNLITKTNQGSDADFMLNGTVHITKQSNVINDVISGVSFTLQKTGDAAVNLTLATDGSQLAGALQTFVHSYNALVDQNNQQIGSAGGPLSGDLLIHNISDDLRRLSSYWATSGSVRSLSDLGVTFDKTGHLSFSQSTFGGLSNTQISDAFKFLGSSKSGFAMLANNFTQLSDPTEGMIRLEEDGLDRQNTQLTSHISILNSRVTQLQASMAAKLQAADALVAELQSRQTAVNASIQSINYVTYGKVTNSNGQ